MPTDTHPRSRSFALALGLLGSLCFCRGALAADADFWLRALAATEERRHADVVATLSEVQPVVRGARGDLLLALSLAALDEYAEALAALPDPAAVRDWPKQVQDDIATRRLHWAARAGHCEVLKDAADLGPGLRVPAARCALGEGKPERALELLEGSGRIDAGELRAQARAESGDAEGSRKELRDLWISHPAHPHAERWLERLKEADPKFDPSDEERVQRAKGFLQARRFQAAVDELKPVRPRGTRSERAALLHLRGTALYRTRNHYAEAAKVLARAAALKGATEASDAFHSARAYSRAGQNERAIRDYRRFARRYPRSRRVAQALYLAAWLEAREGRPKAASRALLRLAKHPALDRDPGTREKALWELGWQAHERGIHRRAAEHLSRYGESARSSLERARGHYWAGVSLAHAKRRDEALEQLTLAAHVEPLGYYALLARRKARELGLALPDAFPEQPEPNAFARPEVQLPDAARFYASLSLPRLAADAIGELKDLSREERVAMLVETGEPESSHRSAHGLHEALFRKPVSEDSRWLWRALYPTPFEAAVQTAVERRKLPPTLLYAHMLVESRFDPFAVSGAGARGLLQLMPATARRVAAQLNETSDEARLLNPAFNVELGANYLAGLLDHYDGAFPPAIAAYNAGRANVDGWLQEKPVPMDEWVERIPIQQTRNYVRRVLTHWARYRYLRGTEPWEPPLPDQLGRPSKEAAELVK